MPIKKKNTPSTKVAENNITESKKSKKLVLTLELNDITQKVTGGTVVECMKNIMLPDAPATPALLIFTQGKDELTIRLQVSAVRNYINNETARELLHDSWQSQLNTL